jgi:dienelactone hydrolase
LKPAGARGPLPGILALHDDGHFKFYGKEKIADGPAGSLYVLKRFRDACYGGRAYCNLLAREGFTIVVHDAFFGEVEGFPWTPSQKLN